MILAGASKLKVGIIITLVLALGSLGWLYRSELKHSAQLAKTVMQQRTTLDDQQEHIKEIETERARLEDLLEDHIKRLHAVKEESREIRRKLQEIKEQEEVASWGSVELPASVVDLLHQDGYDN